MTMSSHALNFYNSQSVGSSILDQIHNSNLSANDIEVGINYYNKIFESLFR